MPGPHSNGDRLRRELRDIVQRTEDGSLAWEGVLHPEDGSVMLWKAPWGDGFTLYVNDEQGDGGPSVALYDDEDIPGVPEDMLLADHEDAETGSLVWRLVNQVVATGMA